MLGYIRLVAPVLLLPQIGKNSKMKHALKTDFIMYIHGFASGVYLLPYSPQFPLHHEAFLPPPLKSCGWNLLPFNMT